MSTPRPPIQDLADALQRCFDAAVERGTREVSDEIGERLDRMDGRLDRMDGRLDRQDDSLRLMWRQMKGNGKLPIDD